MITNNNYNTNTIDTTNTTNNITTNNIDTSHLIVVSDFTASTMRYITYYNELDTDIEYFTVETNQTWLKANVVILNSLYR